MKRILLRVLIIGLALTILFPLSVSAKSIPTINVTNNNNKLTVSGTTENGVLAVAIMVYSGNDIYHMETCSSNDNKFSCELSKTFAIGDYIVKVADYDGGTYISKNISVKGDTSVSVKDETPKTGTIEYIGITTLIITISVLGISILKRKEA